MSIGLVFRRENERSSRSAGRSLRVLLTLACLAGQPGCGMLGRETRPNIVFITIDTLRADRLGAYGYFRNTSPALDALASESILFERCFAPMATTFPSHLSLFTGTYPNETGAIANVGEGGRAFQSTDYVRTLAEFLRDDGYHTAAFVSASPLKRFSGIAAGFDVFHQPENKAVRAEVTNSEVFDWLETKGDQPSFLWVHYFDPHAPVDPPRPFADKYRSEPRLRAYLRERRLARRSATLNNGYDGEVSYVDQQIGELLDVLRSRTDEWEDTVVIVLSDHGEGLKQHGERGHGGVWKEQLHVPLLMRVPGHPPARIDRLMSVVDVVPTLMGLVELPYEAAFRRQASGFDRRASEPGTTFIFSQESSAAWRAGSESGPRYVLTGDEWKCVFGPNGRASLFQLSTDPHELVNVSKDHPEIVERLRAILMERLEEQEARRSIYEATRGATDGEIDPAIVEELRSLGYLE